MESQRQDGVNMTEEKCKVQLDYNVMGIASDISIQCKNCESHCYTMTFPKRNSKGHKRSTDSEANVMASLPFH